MSEWHERAIVRRDARHTKLPELEPPKPVPAKKDTRRWCGGHVGRAHVLVWKRRQPQVTFTARGRFSYGSKWLDYTCTRCGKQLDYWWPRKRDKYGTKVPRPKVE